MLILSVGKLFVFAGLCITLAGAALGTGILFAGYLISAAKNPEEADKLFNNTWIGFALIETFVFMSFMVAAIAYGLF